MAATPEASEYTSIRARVQGRYRQRTQSGPVARMLERGELHQFDSSIRPLMGFSDGSVEQTEGNPRSAGTLPIREQDYLQLVDMTGQLVAGGKRGRIDPLLTPILNRLGLSPAQWSQASTAFRRLYRNGQLRLRQRA
jgi:hypothetical protein